MHSCYLFGDTVIGVCDRRIPGNFCIPCWIWRILNPGRTRPLVYSRDAAPPLQSNIYWPSSFRYMLYLNLTMTYGHVV